MSRQTRHGFPAGTELVFGPLAAQQRRVSGIVASVMHGWGFTELILPAFDHAETFKGSAAERDLYHFTNRKGQQLTLRADFTRLAAKAIAPLLDNTNDRICATYEGKVFRSQAAGHGNRIEQFQRGLEWVNASGRTYDAAILMIVRETLQAVGLRDAKVVVGHAGFIYSILGEAGRKDSRLLEAIDHKNPSRIRDLAIRNGMSDENVELLTNLPLLTGDASVLDAAEKLSLPDAAKLAVRELREIYEMLNQIGQHDHLMFDLGEVRRFHYYSGFMFKVYHNQIGTEFGG
ncbi:MAG: ATP phosphoribosyltransferase regulatory subunit, partial [Planctomycetota bacterium]